MRRSGPLSRVDIFVAALVVSLFLGFPAGSRAVVKNSKHDFSSFVNLASGGGECAPCHDPHYAPDALGIWVRNLSQERTYFNRLANPNYVPGTTLLCYDCHDNHSNIYPVDDEPPDSAFNSSRRPQDVAFDLDMKILPRDGSPTDGKPGYYENVPSGTIPPASTLISGHYIKTTQVGGSISVGDKLPCRDCHDPHDTTNTAFIRKTLAGKPLSGIKASTYMAYDTSPVDPTTRDDADSRKFCIACHGTSEQITYQAVTFSAVNPNYGSGTIVPPTQNVSAHRDGKAQACTSCHFHNRIVARCDECHGFPPLVGTPFNASTNKSGESYTGGAGAHRRHLDALGAAVFDCAICHGPNAGGATWHNNGSGTVTAARVDIMGETSWWGSGSTYYGVDGLETLPAGYAFEKKGGGDRICAGLACHGQPPNVNNGDAGVLNWSDDMVDDATGAATADIEVCAWCHDATPAVLDKDGAGATYGPVKAPNIMGAGSGTAAWGAEVNGHGLASGNNYEGDAVGELTRTGRPARGLGCVVCHDATYTVGTGPNKPHFDGSYNSADKRLNTAINSQTLTTLIPASGTILDAACLACHQRSGTYAGLQISSHGNKAISSYQVLEPSFQRECRSCHEPHGRNWNGAGRNLHMIGAWLDSPTTGTWGVTDAGTPGEEARVDSSAAGDTVAVAITTADNKVVFTSRTGADSFDEVDSTDADDICATCHTQVTVTPTGTGGGSHSGSTLMSGNDQRGNNCMSCHDHDFDDSIATYRYDAFLGAGAPDMLQFFDTTSSTSNYNTVSGHALNITSVTYTAPVPDCLLCHKSVGGTGVSNECLKCHYEGYLSGGVWYWSGHANGSLGLRSATPVSPAPPYNTACVPGTNCISIPRRSTNIDADGTADVYPNCLACHDVAAPAASHQLGSPAQSPVDIVPAARTWTNTIGHGSTSSLSSSRGANAAGPPAYDCGACHASTVPVNAAPETPPPSYHASLNLKLVANTTAPYQTPEYTTTLQKNAWCATRCHRKAGGVAKDDKVVDHTWAIDNLETANQTNCPITNPAMEICETHPSYMTIDTFNPLYQLPVSLPYDPLTYQFICLTCHEPHGNPASTDGQMIRINFSGGSLCNQCHL